LQWKSFLRGTSKKIATKSLAEGNALIIKIKYKIALRIAVEILFMRNEQKIATKSLAEGNAQNILIGLVVSNAQILK
jgi:hypothetical protein